MISKFLKLILISEPDGFQLIENGSFDRDLSVFIYLDRSIALDLDWSLLS